MPDDSEKRALILANRLDPDALEANRSGLLTSQQIKLLGSRRFARGMAMVVIGIICITVGARGLLPSQQSPDSGRFGTVTVLIFGVVILALRFSDFGRSYGAELVAGRVSSIAGFVRVRHSSSSGDGGKHSYYYKIDGHEFEVTEEGAELINPQSRHRIYYLPNSDIIVNIEPIGQALNAELNADDIAAIVGEPMRADLQKIDRGSSAWPGMVVHAFESTMSMLHVVIGVLFGGQDSSILSFYRGILAAGPDSRPITGLGDEATFSRGQLLVRRGDVFILVIVLSLDHPRDSERVLDIEQRLAALALRSLP